MNNSVRLFLMRKQAAKAKAQARRDELDSITISDQEILEILRLVEAKTYDFMGNLDTVNKLRSMHILRQPTVVERNSSFGRLFYITKKGEELLRNDR